MWKVFMFLMTSFMAMPSSWAVLKSVKITSKAPITIAGKPYFEVQGFMNGTVQGRVYKAPITILHPQKKEDYSGTAILEARNYTLLETGFIDSKGTLSLPSVTPVRDILGNYIGRSGAIYVSYHWNKWDLDVAEQKLNQVFDHVIENPTDGYQIIADVTTVVKGTFVPGMKSADVAVTTGFSGAAAVTSEYYLHRTGTHPALHPADAYVQVSMGPLCMMLEYDTFTMESFMPCEDPMTSAQGVSKVAVLNAETDVQYFSGEWMRPSPETPIPPNYRVWEVAGGSHIPKGLAMGLTGLSDLFPDLPQPLNFRQNIAQTFKPLAAAIDNMAKWVRSGIEPPPSNHLGGTLPPIYTGNSCSPFFVDLESMGISDDPSTEIDETLVCNIYGTAFAGGGLFPVLDVARDENGNATLGVRLPHVQVPLGKYFGVEHRRSEIPATVQSTFERMIEVELGGYFERFADAKINSLNPTHEIFVNKMREAAQALLNQRMILQADYDDYVAIAEACAVGKQETYSDADLEVCHGVGLARDFIAGR